MIHLPKHETKLMVAIHGWSGIVLGLLLYAVVITGMTAVFASEIGVWSAGQVETRSAFERPIDQAVRGLSARTPAEYRDDVNLFEVGDHGLGVFFHHDAVGADGKPTARGVYYRLNAASRIIGVQRGLSEDVFGPRNDDALRSFLVDTHVRLHLPNPWGLILTGVLGLVMLVAAISGVLIHRHLFKDIFTLRRNASPVLVDRDRHSVAGTWSLPFAFVLAFTGSYFSFFATVGVPIVAMAAFGGDQAAFSDAVFTKPGRPDPTAVPIGNLDRITSDAIRRTGKPPTFITIEKFNRADSAVTTFHPAGAGDIAPVTLGYHGATATFDRIKPLIGTRPSVGGTAAAIMGPLHFGNFAGIVSKSIWFGLGFAMCYVTLTGLRLWLVRRRERQQSLDWLERMVTVVGFGLPFSLAVAAAGFLVTFPLGTAVFWTSATFLIAAGIAIVGGFVVPSNAQLDNALRAATGVTLLALPLIRLIAGGPGWGTVFAAGQPIIIAGDMAMAAAGGWMLLGLLRTLPRKIAKPAMLQPAE